MEYRSDTTMFQFIQGFVYTTSVNTQSLFKKLPKLIYSREIPCRHCPPGATVRRKDNRIFLAVIPVYRRNNVNRALCLRLEFQFKRFHDWILRASDIDSAYRNLRIKALILQSGDDFRI